MEYNALDAGILPGGLRNTTEIRLLVCYLVGRYETPLRKNIVAMAMHQNGLANYFEVLDAFENLYSRGIIGEDNGFYYLTLVGDMVLRDSEEDLPKSVRDKSIDAIKNLYEMEKQERENLVTIENVPNGHTVRCRVSGGETDLIDIKIYVPGIGQAEQVKANFRKNAPLIYSAILASLIGDSELLAATLCEVYDFGLKK